MSHRTETVRATALAKIREAEEADFLCLIEHAKEDLGGDLSTWLDGSTGLIVHGTGIDRFKWQVGHYPAVLASRLPDCTEILVQYTRQPDAPSPNNPRPHPTYYNHEWLPQLWTSRGHILSDYQEGRFAVVRYESFLGKEVKPVSQMMNQWFLTNDIDHAKLAGKKFCKEKLELEERVKKAKEQAVEDQLRRFR